MSRLRLFSSSAEVRPLLDRVRDIPPLPPSVRARALTRARAALRAGDVAAPQLPRGMPRARWAAAAALVCMGGAAVGAAAYEVRARLAPPPDADPMAAPAEVAATPPAAARIANAPPAPGRAIPAARSRSLRPPDALRAELRLLRQARAAVAREDFAAALPSIAAHARRFEHGRLAEEREALRVKALAALGRAEEARHAAADFEGRFPRSVLLPAVATAASGP